MVFFQCYKGIYWMLHCREELERNSCSQRLRKDVTIKKDTYNFHEFQKEHFQLVTDVDFRKNNGSSSSMKTPSKKLTGEQGDDKKSVQSRPAFSCYARWHFAINRTVNKVCFYFTPTILMFYTGRLRKIQTTLKLSQGNVRARMACE